MDVLFFMIEFSLCNQLIGKQYSLNQYHGSKMELVSYQEVVIQEGTSEISSQMRSLSYGTVHVDVYSGPTSHHAGRSDENAEPVVAKGRGTVRESPRPAWRPVLADRPGSQGGLGTRRREKASMLIRETTLYSSVR